jgi:focal adhesion kinase 1
LIDGYCKLFNDNNQSVWDRTIKANTDSLEKRIREETQLEIDNSPKPIFNDDYSELHTAVQDVDEEGDYSTPTSRNYELQRDQITLNEIIGIGQFGDVFIGSCRIRLTSKTEGTGSDEDVISVAVKTCKADADLKTSEKFLEEACKLKE